MGIKRFVEETVAAASGLSLKEELEIKQGKRDDMQEQINRLGEEVAMDINDLEKRINALLSQKPSNSTSPFQNTYSTI